MKAALHVATERSIGFGKALAPSYRIAGTASVVRETR
jgi:hypothetical protein